LGKKDGRAVKHTYNVKHPLDWHEKAAGKMTGIPMSIGMQMLAKGEIKVKGVLPPEMAIEPIPFLAQLAKRGIEMSEQEE
jgi:saccharopine dehydrogenase-like NADP-dependent oxidoreductase